MRKRKPAARRNQRKGRTTKRTTSPAARKSRAARGRRLDLHLRWPTLREGEFFTPPISLEKYETVDLSVYPPRLVAPHSATLVVEESSDGKNWVQSTPTSLAPGEISVKKTPRRRRWIRIRLRPDPGAGSP